MTLHTQHPIALIILDGWGCREEPEANAIAQAHKPNWIHFWNTYPHTLLSGSGRCVGLPDKQMGNSEVGHLTMGAGRIVHQDLTRIDQAIENGEFFTNPILNHALVEAKESNKALHILGLLSAGGVHSHENHFFALISLAAKLNLKNVYIHIFLDGRDTPPQSAEDSIKKLIAHCHERHCGMIASMIGRYYAMDRDKRWERIKKAYDLLVEGKADYHVNSALDGLMKAYERGENDEFVSATSIYTNDASPITIKESDTVIFMNFRADRARELTRSFIDPGFKEFHRETWPVLNQFVCLSEYDATFQLPTAFAPLPLTHLFADIISKANFSQLRIAETEKYAHVTFFFNGGVELPFPGEDRILIPSPKVATYDLQPEMSALELTDRLINEIKKKKYDVMICNFANPDMLGHTGNLAATIKGIEIIDICLGKLIEALKQTGAEALITADHGNAEQMYDYQTNQPHTAHTSDPVPFLYIGRNAEIVKNDGKLSDIAPTMLYLLDLPQPKEMTGKSLVKIT